MAGGEIGSMAKIPRVLFVLGKGGTGRSSVAAALGWCFAARGENTLIVEWTFSEPIAPWFGQPPAGHDARELTPRLSAMNFSLDETLREYFVGHLGLRFLHDLVIANRHMQRLIHAAPGIAELLFCGRIYWLTALAREEVGLDFQRIVVDAPATGHGAPLFAIPQTLAAFDAAGLLALERQRVTQMFADPEWTGALVVTLAEELAVAETMELLPRVRRDLGRPPLALLVNRAVDRFVTGDRHPAWLEELAASSGEGVALRTLHAELIERKEREAALRQAGGAMALLGALPLEDRLLAESVASPLDVVRLMARELDAILPGRA
ncbi:MAG TPA: ArsA-related P-loop ATPase [Myxococcales bacterium]